MIIHVPLPTTAPIGWLIPGRTRSIVAGERRQAFVALIKLSEHQVRYEFAEVRLLLLFQSCVAGQVAQSLDLKQGLLRFEVRVAAQNRSTYVHPIHDVHASLLWTAVAVT